MTLINILKYFYQSLHPEVRLFLRNYGVTFLAKKILVLIKFGFLKKITLDNGLILSLANDHDYELRANYLSDILANNFETQKINIIKQALCPGDKFIDVGCSFGLFSLIASEIVGTNGEVLAFDPSDTAIKTLKVNSQINGFKNIKTFNIALGNSDKLVDFFGENYGGTIIKGNPQYETSKGQKVKMKKLDSILFSSDLENLKFIKIDAEGSEFEIIKGAENIMKNSKNLVVSLELGEKMLTSSGSSIEEVINTLMSMGYRNFIDITNNDKIIEINSSNFMKDLQVGKFGSFFNPQVGFFCEIIATKNRQFKEKAI